MGEDGFMEILHKNRNQQYDMLLSSDNHFSVLWLILRVCSFMYMLRKS